MKKIFLTILIIFPIIASAETITYSDSLQVSLDKLKAEVTSLKVDIAKYKVEGLTTADKARLIAKISELKKSAADLRVKISSMQQAPTTVSNPTVLNNPVGTNYNISITSPSSGVTWYKGSKYPIRIKVTDVPKIGMTLYRSTGEFAATIDSSFSPDLDTIDTYNYTVPSTLYDGDYYISFYDTRNTSRVWKSPVFKITPKPLIESPVATPDSSPGSTPPPVTLPAQIQVTSPNGGEKWEQGKSYSTRWDSTKTGGTATITLKNLDNNQTWTFSKSNIQTSSSYSLNISSDIIPGSYKIYISTTDGVSDESDNVFYVVKAKPKITSISPSILYPGTSVRILGDFPSSYLTLYFKNSTTISPITPTIISSTELRFTVPTWANGTYDLVLENDEFLSSDPYGVTVYTSSPTSSPSPSGTPVSVNSSIIQNQRASIFEMLGGIFDWFTMN